MDNVPQQSGVASPSLWRRYRVGRRITEPGCGRCGYPVRGLHTPICPECGANRNVVGVVRPYRPSRALGTLGLLAAWAAVLGALAWVGNDALLSLTPRDLSNHRDYRLYPESGMYGPLDVRRIGYGWGWRTERWAPRSPDRGWIKMTHGVPGPHFETQADFSLGQPSLSYAITQYNGDRSWASPVFSQTALLDEQGLSKWLERMYIDPTHPEVRAEVAELLALLKAPDFAPAHHEGLRHFTVASVKGGPEIVAKRHGQGVLTGAWVAVALAGALLIARLRRGPGASPVRVGDGGNGLAH